ncbi:MAG: tetratricopeptide repeat protein [Porticoccaceae bacterium]
MIRKALRLAPNDPVVLSYCGFAATFAGNAVGAIDYLERSLSINPNSSFSQFSYGAALLFSGRLEESITQSQFFIDRYPKDPYISLAFYYLASAYLVADEPLKAEQAVRNCIKHSPDYPWGHLILALILQAQGRLDDAQQRLDMARKLEPDWTPQQIEDIFRFVFVRPQDADAWIAILHQAWAA